MDGSIYIYREREDSVPFCDWLFTSRLDSNPGIVYRYMFRWLDGWIYIYIYRERERTAYPSATGYSHRVWTPIQVLYIDMFR